MPPRPTISPRCRGSGLRMPSGSSSTARRTVPSSGWRISSMSRESARRRWIGSAIASWSDRESRFTGSLGPVGARGERDAGSGVFPAPGFSLLESLAATAILAALIAAAVPLVARMVARERLHAASLETALLFRGLRQRAVSEGSAYGVRFVLTAGGWTCGLVRDGNGNGLRTSEILSGRDPAVEGPCDPALRHEGVRIGLPGVTVPQVPPGTGTIPTPADPVKFGSGSLVSFSPAGSVSGGTLYLTDGQRVGAVVVYGPTGRIRLFRHEPGEGR